MKLVKNLLLKKLNENGVPTTLDKNENLLVDLIAVPDDEINGCISTVMDNVFGEDGWYVMDHRNENSDPFILYMDMNGKTLPQS